MKIALFTDSYLPNSDGVVSSILAFKQGLAAKGHAFEIFAPDAPGAAKEEGIHRFAAVKFPPYPDYRAAIFPYVSSSVAKKTGVQLVHSKGMVSMGLAAMSFASRAKLPCLASLETMIPEGIHYLVPHAGMQKIGRKVAWSYLRWLYAHFDLTTAPSKHTQTLMAENGIASEVLPSPIDTHRFSPDAASGAAVRRELGLSGKRVILSVGRVVKEKNYSFLLRAAKAMNDTDAVFLIVGKGPHLEETKKEAAAMGVSESFRFAGFVPDEKLVAYYNAADAFAFPSGFETQGITLLEALACGKPACVLAGTPMQEIITEGKNGYVFPLDEKECAQKLEACAWNSKRMSDAARESALDYSIAKCTGRLIKIYERLLEK